MLARPHRTYHPQAPYGDPWHTEDPQEQSLPDSGGRGDRRALRRSLRRNGGDVSKRTDCHHGRCNRPVSPARDPRSHKLSGVGARERPARARRTAEVNSISQPRMTGSVDERIIVEDQHGREISLSGQLGTIAPFLDNVKGQLVAMFLSLRLENGPVRVGARSLTSSAGRFVGGRGPELCALVRLLSCLLVRPCRGLFSGKPAMASAIGEVDHESYRHPDEEPQPCAGGQETHEEEA
jgi:hypothetical protein